MAKDTDYSPLRLAVSPGGLLRPGEAALVSVNVAGALRVLAGGHDGFAEVARARLAPGEPWRWLPSTCGRYALEFTADFGETLRRPLAVADHDWAVCQITVGAFTAEVFSDLIHDARVAADYYVTLPRPDRPEGFSASDPRWRDYERLHGDAIHPHVMSNAFGHIAPELAHDNPNWETLSQAGIEERLRALQAWWVAAGYAPLDRIATYTPCNLLTRACAGAGVRVVHSLCPEQNWSDGEWAINHWGMPTAPFWIAADDFRKAGRRDANGCGVLGITMNHYQVLLPHLTHWGDFVLSPSHFTRWIRAADSGEESTRFRQFLGDTVRGGAPLGDAPFFFVAGFEFGRTFGTANMTAYNRAGLARLLELAKTEKLVFATSPDVRAYYDRHVDALPDRAFRQRDSWVGVTVNGKPGQAGDSVVIERGDYKALIREGANHPFFYYDYTRHWSFATADIHAPADYASACAGELEISELSASRLRIEARAPLSRAVPVALWDAVVDDTRGLVRLPLRELDDGRVVTLLEAPTGWRGRVELETRPSAPVRPTHRDGRWVLQTFGEGAETHTYLHLDAPLTGDVRAPVRLTRETPVDGAQGPLGVFPAGEHELAFGPLRGWYRFWGCGVADILPAEDIETRLRDSGLLLTTDAAEEAHAHAVALDARAWEHPALRGKGRVLTAHCGVALSLGTRSRSTGHDRLVPHEPGVTASEQADGVIAFGPGRSFWYHPRGLHFRVGGLKAEGDGDRWTVLLHSFDPQRLGAVYRVGVGTDKRAAGVWRLPETAHDPAACFPVELTAAGIDAHGRAAFELRSDQPGRIHWWRDGGYIAALHALWVGKS